LIIAAACNGAWLEAIAPAANDPCVRSHRSIVRSTIDHAANSRIMCFAGEEPLNAEYDNGRDESDQGG
jgi:hypothetical protein